MKDRPIIFSAPMVRAIIDGSKSQTRRVVKPRKDVAFGCLLQPHELAGEVNAGNLENCPYGKIGDRLWVRETFQGPLLESEEQEDEFRYSPDIYKKPGFCAYRATDTLDAIDSDGRELGWRPSIFMPRWASRILLEVTGIRVERLQEISEADAKAEGADDGFRQIVAPGNCPEPRCDGVHYGPLWHFRDIWNSIHGPDAWDANPWVAAISFTVHRCNIDQVKEVTW